MTRKTSVNVLYLPGTNCQEETLRAFTRVGAKPRILLLADLLSGAEQLDSADLLCVPGGFSFGDHLGAGTVAGVLLRTRFRAELERCRTRMMLCICNGFQIAVRARCFGGGVALVDNECGTFRNVPNQAHIVDLHNPSPWLSGLGGLTLRFPCAHAEGRFYSVSPVPSSEWLPAFRYPSGENPDGSMWDLAGITSPDGLLLGLMNHPERGTNDVANVAVFANGIAAYR